MAKTVAAELPHNTQAEQAVIGSAFLNEDSLISVISSLSLEDFYDVKHQIIYKALKNAFDKKVKVDILTITEELMNMKELDNVGGVKYLQQCADSMVALSALEYYINIVSDQSTLRKLLLAVRDIDKDYRENEIANVDDFVEQAEVKIKEATEKRRVGGFKTSEELINKIAAKISHPIQTGEDDVTGITTGYSGINKLTSGFQPEEMTIIAARPSVGKTALALNFAIEAAKKAHKHVAIFTLEMSDEKIMERLISRESYVPFGKVIRGKINATERARVKETMDELASLPIHVDELYGGKLMDIVAKSRKLQAQLQAEKQELGMIILDYIGLVNSSEQDRNGRADSIRKVSAALKDLARELKIPVVVLCQVSRKAEDRDNKMPVLSDLKDSGSIEQDADVVMLLYRKDYYNLASDKQANKKAPQMNEAQKKNFEKTEKEKLLAERMPGDTSYVEVIIAKNRNGSVGKTGLFFMKEYQKFETPPKDFEEQARELDQFDDF